jgi:DNA repair protein RadC
MTDKELIRRLLRISENRIRGKSMYEIINSLPDKRAELLKEICCRYGERRLPFGEQFTKSEQIYDHFKMRVSAAQETLFCVYLDSKSRMISEQLISMGTLDTSLVHSRECFAPAIQIRAARILLIHSHPSQDPRPSANDIIMTERLCKVGELVGIHVLDHVIIGFTYYSFKDEGILPEPYEPEVPLSKILLKSGIMAPIEEALKKKKANKRG